MHKCTLHTEASYTCKWISTSSLTSPRPQPDRLKGGLVSSNSEPVPQNLTFSITVEMGPGLSSRVTSTLQTGPKPGLERYDEEGVRVAGHGV